MTDTHRHLARSALGITFVFVVLPIAALAVGRVLARRLESGDAESDEMRRLAVMNGVDMAVTSKALRHARFDIAMGGVAVDLTAAGLDQDGATIEIFGAMGGVDLKVPATWAVTAESDSRTTGMRIDVTSKEELASNAPRLQVISHARMSGVNVEAM